MLSRRGRSASPEPPRPPGVPMIETPKGRKKFSFKEPEIMGFLGFRRMSLMRRGSRAAARSKSLQPTPARKEHQEVVKPAELEELEVLECFGLFASD